jgi:hypothetical protein
MNKAATKNPNVKMSLSAASSSDVQGFKQPERTVSPASQPLWTRYIDSRLKQFGTTR